MICKFIEYGDTDINADAVTYLNKIGEAFPQSAETDEQRRHFIIGAINIASALSGVSVDDIRKSVIACFESEPVLTVKAAAAEKHTTPQTIRNAVDVKALDVVPGRSPVMILGNAKYRAWQRQRHGRPRKHLRNEK